MESKTAGDRTVVDDEESLLTASSKGLMRLAGRRSYTLHEPQSCQSFDNSTQFLAVPPSYMGEQCLGLRAFSTGDSTIPEPKREEAKGEGSSKLSSSTK